MNHTLLDTCVVIDYLRQEDSAVSYIHQLPAIPQLSSITIMELYAGIKGRREQRRIETMINHSLVLDITHEIGVKSGEYLKKYRPSHGVGAIDALIAATAEIHGLELATLNLKHFPMFKNLERPY